MTRVQIRVDDTHAGEHFKRYRSGDEATVLEHKSRLASGRWWHYKVKLDGPIKTPCGLGLSTIAYLTKDQVKKI